ncbi:MAG TPA: hypothetical protein QF564_29705 [Pirellulaceae bacterium]|nr:hypothetical protein [Pirellulaceae bacterium]
MPSEQDRFSLRTLFVFVFLAACVCLGLRVAYKTLDAVFERERQIQEEYRQTAEQAANPDENQPR